LRAVATSAARDARNADELLAAVRRAAGLRVEVISGEQEAEWVYRGVTSGRELHGIPLLILDVGGGSTEFILGDHGHHSFRQSFPLGSVRLLETLKPGDPPTFHELTVCRDWLGNFLDGQVVPVLEKHLRPAADAPLTLVGTGGAATILARMMKRLATFDREKIDGARLSHRQVLEYLLDLWARPLAARRTMTGVPPSRADVIIMGAAIYEAVMRRLQLAELCVSTRGLRHGALLDQP
jgi:exopolyphosphatase / guanosine-5'-triphosphate,3'-diphosphate pyrophosphatase